MGKKAPDPRLLFLLAATAAASALALISQDIGLELLPRALLLACLPVPIYVAIALWVDRYEPEPPILLWSAFCWGASLAVLISYLLNTAYTLRTFEQTRNVALALDLSTIVSAPIVEESSKAVALFLLFWWRRREFDGAVDGFIYASMVALGFAMIENVQYYGVAMKKGQVTTIFVLRGVFSAFAHPLFTAMTGMGLGWACESTRRDWKWLYPLGGFLLAVSLHCLWNLSATIHLFFWLLSYLFVMCPTLLLIGVALQRALAREGQCLRQYLIHDLPTDELRAVSSVAGRMAYSWRYLRTQGIPGWLYSEQYLKAASNLAFHRRRKDLGLVSDGPEEAEIKACMNRFKALLNRRFARPID